MLSVLRDHLELQDFIAHVSDEAKRTFSDVAIELDTVRYDEWDPPLRMLVHVPRPWDEYSSSVDAFTHWVVRHPEYDRDLTSS